MIDINHDETSIMGLFLSNHSWSRTHTGAISSAGNMCVYIQSQLTTERDRGSFLCKGRRPTEAPSSRPTSLERLNCERLVALLRRGTSTPPPTLLFLRTAFHTLGTGQDGHRCLHDRRRKLQAES